MITALVTRLRPSPKPDQAARIFTRLFQSDDGQFVLHYLHRHIMFRQTAPDITAHELRFLEGQRQLILMICALSSPTPIPPEPLPDHNI